MLRSKNKPKIVIVSNLWCEILKIKKKKSERVGKNLFNKTNEKKYLYLLICPSIRLARYCYYNILKE